MYSISNSPNVLITIPIYSIQKPAKSPGCLRGKYAKPLNPTFLYLTSRYHCGRGQALTLAILVKAHIDSH